MTGHELLAKALAIGTELKGQGFSEYNSFGEDSLDLNWVDRWRKRHSISSRKICGESNAADHEAVSDWLGDELLVIRQEFPDEDIFNADETGLFCKLLPERTLAFNLV